ncbi:hypothetical protein OIU78_017892 [Salix suchowensis]|nr:hypothetical protein OIU78_017892 [Salix suchowensis]
MAEESSWRRRRSVLLREREPPWMTTRWPIGV